MVSLNFFATNKKGVPDNSMVLKPEPSDVPLANVCPWKLVTSSSTPVSGSAVLMSVEITRRLPLASFLTINPILLGIKFWLAVVFLLL